ncbi:MAG: Hint domain-containing protein, partial [Alphaproteobacteria bacterium]|nr:Hint domain-containing protein [Alphaproteobacteria bacterium]
GGGGGGGRGSGGRGGSGGSGGFGGGRGDDSAFTIGPGGGGLGAGGDIFVQAGGVFTVEGGSLTGGLVTAGGAGGFGAGNGAALGSSLFLQVASGDTDNFASAIKDGTGQPGQVFVMGATSGSGGLGNSGGTLVLTGASTYTGGTTVDGGAAVSISADDNLGASSSPVTLDNSTELVFTASFTLTHNLTISGDPTFDVAPGTTVTQTGTISDGSTPGDVMLTGGGTFKLDQQNSYSGGTTIDNGTLDFAHAGAAGSGPIGFDSTSNSKTLLIDFGEAPANNGTFGNAIGNFDSTDDVIELKGVGFEQGASATDDGSHLVFSDGNYTVTFDLTNSTAQPTEHVYSDGAGDSFITDNANYNPPCYCAGTMILTERGEVAVEDLRIGDRVATVLGRRWRAIEWIGHRRIDSRRHLNPDRVTPIRVAAGAFGEELPLRDLYLSPGHSVFVKGVLIPIEHLVNGTTIAPSPCATVTYWHVELDRHDILLAEGLAAESYLDTGNRTAFENGGAFFELHPDFKPKQGKATYVPLCHYGFAVEQAKAMLMARASEMLGGTITTDADPHIVAEGRRCEAVRLGRDRLAFMLPEGSAEIALMSRRFVPAHTIPASDDRRCLGLCIGRLQVDGRDLPLDDDHALCDGWYGPERGSGPFHRWTTGSTPLPAATRLVLIDLASHGRYWKAESAAERQA